MRKILLVLEDYAERSFLATLLGKVGWDVAESKSETGLQSLVLDFHPDLVLIHAFGTRIQGELFFSKVSGLKKKPKVLLLTKKRRLSKEQCEALGFDGAFSSPVDIRALFLRLEELGGIPVQQAFAKLSQQKKAAALSREREQEASKLVRSKSEPAKESSTAKPVSEVVSQEEEFPNPQLAIQKAQAKLDAFRFSDPQRAARNAQFIRDNPLEDRGFNGIPKAVVEEQVKEFRRLADDPEIEQIDRDRKEFVVAMFRLAKKDD